jgi:hypothetical protein
MGFFDNETNNLINEQEKKKDALGLDANVSKKKAHLHVTLPQSTYDKLKKLAKERNLSLSVMVQILIDENC